MFTSIYCSSATGGYNEMCSNMSECDVMRVKWIAVFYDADGRGLSPYVNNALLLRQIHASVF